MVSGRSFEDLRRGDELARGAQRVLQFHQSSPWRHGRAAHCATGHRMKRRLLVEGFVLEINFFRARLATRISFKQKRVQQTINW